jgi:hypothetical protein
MRRELAVVAALAVTLIVAGCGGGTTGTSGTTTATATTATPTVTLTTETTTTPTTSTTTTGPPTALRWPPAGLKAGQNPVLRTPSGNIECNLVKTVGVVCNASKHEWTLPPKPASCEFEWTDAVGLGPTGRPRFWCSSNAAIYDGPYWPRFTFPYGTSVSGGGITCVSRVSGVTCTNRDKHGLFLSRQRVTFF